MNTSWIMLLFFCIAVPAPTNLGFGHVEPDSMEVTWVSPHVPNNADINSFLIRYENKQKKPQYCLFLTQTLSWIHMDF